MIMLFLVTNKFDSYLLLQAINHKINATLKLPQESLPANFENLFELVDTTTKLQIYGVEFEKNRIIKCDYIVLDPDFNVDASRISRCFTNFGGSHYKYFINESVPFRGSPIYGWAGAIMGEYLNRKIIESKQDIDGSSNLLNDIIREAIIDNPFIVREPKFREYREEELPLQAQHIDEKLTSNIISQGRVLLEPSFISSKLGINGRFDLLQYNSTPLLIDLKSGKMEENIRSGKVDHHYQLNIYKSIWDFERPTHKISTATLMYSKYPNRSHSINSWVNHGYSEVYFINTVVVRNRIVAMMKRLSQDENVKSEFESITYNHAIRHLLEVDDKYRDCDTWTEKNFRTDFDNYLVKYKSLDVDKKTYILQMISFVTREQRKAKLFEGGEIDAYYQASLWNMPIQQKMDVGFAAKGFKIIDNKIHTPDRIIKFCYSSNEINLYFKKGDAVVCYEYKTENEINSEKQNNSIKLYDINKVQVLKGIITEVFTELHKNNQKEIITLAVKFKTQQSSEDAVDASVEYVIEQDYFDNYRKQWENIISFSRAEVIIQDLILGVSPPKFTPIESIKCNVRHDIPEFQQYIKQILSAQNYSLVVGPPGTGKTKQLLNGLVREYFANPQAKILITAFTNRAITEICESLDTLEYVKENYLVISKDSNLSRNVTNIVRKFCKTPNEIKEKLDHARVYVGTISTISGMEKFLLENHIFDVLIVDEASQILEPQIIGLLSNKSVKKFVLIGDHLQLPAVVLQKPEESKIVADKQSVYGNLQDRYLLTDRRLSLFERLIYINRRFNPDESSNPAIIWLTTQGRMHKDICNFVSKTFYQNRLKTLGELIPTTKNIHQIENSPFVESHDYDYIQQHINNNRLCFFNKLVNEGGIEGKNNIAEALSLIKILRCLIDMIDKSNKVINGKESDDKNYISIGIISPFKLQCASIRNKLRHLAFEFRENGKIELANAVECITVDTVERYQGAQRDIIIYSSVISKAEDIEKISDSSENFFRSHRVDRKLNVALTRAKSRFILLGSSDALKSGNNFYAELFKYIQQSGGVFNYN